MRRQALTCGVCVHAASGGALCVPRSSGGDGESVQRRRNTGAQAGMHRETPYAPAASPQRLSPWRPNPGARSWRRRATRSAAEAPATRWSLPRSLPVSAVAHHPSARRSAPAAVVKVSDGVWSPWQQCLRLCAVALC
ncbi:hypothetical protein AAFF_G00312500 [Aldrovandia affinis]|uniref:Uncharacterized protein n=1 Tax=Aldrovandia affinis TaxID=143900 RepID=A0AAD7SPA2_9TELE|nr:hypothetical protein AAFF_G00312500 [Aldrovandia affinis]